MLETIGTTLEARPSQVAPSTGELALRIRGGDYHGRVVRIRSQQCTIGSAPDCTLRLTGPGVRSLHCIIIRGEAGATVRRWSADTQLNGRAFSDAMLIAGDRLEIGPIELEVLDDAEIYQRRRSDMEPAVPHAPAANLAGEIVSHLRRDLQRDKDVRRRKLARKRLLEARRRIHSLQAELKRVQDAVNSAPAEPSPGLEAERTRLQAWANDLEQRQHANDEAQQRFQEGERQESAAREEVLVLQRRIAHLEAEAASQAASSTPSQDQAQLAAAQQQLHEVFGECERLREELHLAASGLAAARCRLSEQEAALAAFRELHQHTVAELELERDALQAQLTEIEVKYLEQAEQLAELESRPVATVVDPETTQRVVELEERLQHQEEQLTAALSAKQELEGAAEQGSQQWSQRERELTERIECLERLAGTLEDELRKATASPDQVEVAERQRQLLEDQLLATQRQWSEQRQVLEEQSLAAHEQLQEMENEINSVRAAFGDAQARVHERDQLLSQICDEVQQQVAAWQSEREQLLRQLATASEVPHHAPAEPEQHHEPSPAHEYEAPAEEEECVASVIDRLSASGVWRNQDESETNDCAAEEPPTEEAPPGSEQAFVAEAAASVTAPEPRNPAENAVASPQVATTPSPDSANEAEESIETYMARLLKRVRGDAVASAFVSQQADGEATAVSSDAPPTPEAAPLPLNPREFLPRKSAPELTIDVAAMRELAVSTTRQAIAQSSQKRFYRKSLRTTLTACALATVAIALFAWGYDTGNRIAWTGCGICAIGGIVMMARRLSLRPSRKGPAGP